MIIAYGFFERTIKVADLETFAKEGEISDQLLQYANSFGLSDSDLAAIRGVLTQKANFDEVDVAQFLYTRQGTRILRSLGDVVQTPSRQSGFSAIRSALILAAADDPEGLTLLNFLKKYPTPAARIDVSNGLNIASTVAETIGQSDRAIALVQALSEERAAQSNWGLQPIRQLVYEPPQYDFSTQSLRLEYRDVDATLFLPVSRSIAQSLPDDIPVIVISHGLGDVRQSYLYLAEFLATRGFAVATLDHPGSNSEQINRLFAGLSTDIVQDREFIDRPEDISELLDEIQSYAGRDRELRWRINTQNVGVIGQSFGGYTALALAGATYDLEALETACTPQEIYFNLSLLLQCQAGFIADAVAVDPSPLQDERVRAVVTVNPIGRGIFGQTGFSQIDIPVMIISATGDTVAPALPEQIEPFTWLETEHRHLAVAGGTTHFSFIDLPPGTVPSIPVPISMWGDSPQLAQDYLETLSLSFFRRYLLEDIRYDDALTPYFIEKLVERSPLEPLSLIQELSTETLEQAINSDSLIGSQE